MRFAITYARSFDIFSFLSSSGGFMPSALGPDYRGASFSPGWYFASPSGLKFCCDYMMNFSPGTKRKFAWENLQRRENSIDAHALVPFSARANLVPRVLGLLGQRVSARRDSGIIDSIFPENVGSGLITYTPNANMEDHSGGPGLLARKRG